MALITTRFPTNDPGFGGVLVIWIAVLILLALGLTL